MKNVKTVCLRLASAMAFICASQASAMVYQEGKYSCSEMQKVEAQEGMIQISCFGGTRTYYAAAQSCVKPGPNPFGQPTSDYAIVSSSDEASCSIGHACLDN